MKWKSSKNKRKMMGGEQETNEKKEKARYLLVRSQ